MRVTWTLSTLILIGGCVSASSRMQSLAPILPEWEPESFRYFHGSWIRPDSIYAFQLSERTLHVVDASNGDPVLHQFSLDDCPQIPLGFRQLKAALLQTARIASGEIAVDEPSEIVMDGPDYRIEFWSRDASTALTLEGNGNSQLASPWVDAAHGVRAIGDECIDH